MKLFIQLISKAHAVDYIPNSTSLQNVKLPLSPNWGLVELALWVTVYVILVRPLFRDENDVLGDIQRKRTLVTASIVASLAVVLHIYLSFLVS